VNNYKEVGTTEENLKTVITKLGSAQSGGIAPCPSPTKGPLIRHCPSKMVGRELDNYIV